MRKVARTCRTTFRPVITSETTFSPSQALCITLSLNISKLQTSRLKGAP